MCWLRVGEVVPATLVDGCDVVCYEGFWVWCACAWHVVRDVVVDRLPAQPTVATDAAYVVTHAVLHGGVTSDHVGSPTCGSALVVNARNPGQRMACPELVPGVWSSGGGGCYSYPRS